MKNNFFSLVASVVIIAAAAANIRYSESENTLKVSLSDIAIMAKANTEDGDKCPGWDGTPYCQWDWAYDCQILDECAPSCPGGC